MTQTGRKRTSARCSAGSSRSPAFDRSPSRSGHRSEGRSFLTFTSPFLARTPSHRTYVLRVKQNVITPAFFEALGIPLIRGRGFEARDLENDRAVVVNDVLAEQLWPGREAIGRTLMIDGEPHEVVGIVRYDNFRRSGEAPGPFLFRSGLAGNRMMVRVDRDPRQMLALLRREVRAVDPEVAITAERPFADMLRDSFAPVTLAMSVLGNAGGLALLLSAMGLYGVLAVAVAQRTREIGIRMALGATASGVVTLVVRDGTRLVLTGLALGTSWAIASTGGLSDYLHGVTRNDPFTFGVVTLVLAWSAFWPRRAEGTHAGASRCGITRNAADGAGASDGARAARLVSPDLSRAGGTIAT